MSTSVSLYIMILGFNWPLLTGRVNCGCYHFGKVAITEVKTMGGGMGGWGGGSGTQLSSSRAFLHGGGGPQLGEVTRWGGVTRLCI